MAAVTYFVQADPFAGTARKVAGYVPAADVVSATTPLANTSRQDEVLESLRNMPRPVLGVQVKPNTPAYAQVVGKDGNSIDLLNRVGQYTGALDKPGNVNNNGLKSTDTGKLWTSWMLQSVREERMEKTQLVETFGDSYLYAYGEKPRSLQFQGLLLNTEDYDWKTDFWQNWEENFRATKLVERQARMYIRFEDVLVEGYPINASVGQSADSPNLMSFSFLFFVTNYVNTQLLQQQRRNRPFVFTTNLNLQAREQAGIDIRSNQQILQRKYSQAGLSDKITDAILSGDNPSKWAQLGNLAALNGVNLGIDALKASAGGSTAALQSLSVSLARSATTLTQYLANIGITSNGTTLQDFNAWFGYAGGLLTLALDIGQNVTGPTTTSVGEAVDEGLAVVKEALTSGSVDMLISKLGYAAGSALLEATQADNATTNANAKSNAQTSMSVKSAQQVSDSIGGGFEGTGEGQIATAGLAGTGTASNVIEL